MATRSGTLLRRIITILQQLLWKDLKAWRSGLPSSYSQRSISHGEKRKSETFQPEVQDIPDGSLTLSYYSTN